MDTMIAGSPGTSDRGATTADLARFMGAVRKDSSTGCWLWTASVSGGYGRFRAGGRTVSAHRFAYEALVGPIPDGLQLDHVREWGCVHRHCVNPDHLEPVTAHENVRRYVAARAQDAPPTPVRKSAEENEVPVREIEPDPTIVGIAAAAERLGCHPDTVRNLVERGDLPAFRLGSRGHWRLRLADVDAVLRPVHVGRAA